MKMLRLAVTAAIVAATQSTAFAAIDQGIDDPRTGARWIQADTLAEGTALGYRLATTAEFSDYLLSGGYGTYGAQQFFSREVSSSRMGFDADTYVRVSDMLRTQYSSPAVTMGRLAGDDMVGGLLVTSGTALGVCPNGTSYNCYRTFYAHEGAYATLADLQAGKYDFYSYTDSGDWVGALNNLKQADGTYQLGYFMISNVPEPGTVGLMGLGLAAVAWAARRQRGERG